jgi:hypothetical protein
MDEIRRSRVSSEQVSESVPVSDCGGIPVPSLQKIAAALRNVTEVLARELTLPTRQSPDWNDFEWRIARAVVTMHGVAALLLRESRWTGVPNWLRFLCEQRDHIAGRHRRILQVLERIDLRAREGGISLLALKGAALHSMGLYQAGERPMADIDLLVSSDHLQGATRILQDDGFEMTFENWRHRLFEPRIGRNVGSEFGEHIDNPIKIELHSTIRERLPVREVDITQFIFPSAPCPGLNDYRSAGSLMMHLVLHAAGNMRAHALRLVQLHDIAQLGERFSRPDWDELLTAMPNGQSLWWAAAPLILVARYYPAAVPPFVLAKLSSECPWLLRKMARRQCLTDVSWSNIKVYAVPGIEWSRTPREALGFIAGRIWPNREMRAELRRFTAPDSQAPRIPWYGISQPARILRWIFLRPPRVQTLLAVRAALRQSL